MKKELQSRKRLFWLTSVAIALLVHATGLLFFQLGEEEPPAEWADLSFVSLPSTHRQEAQGDLLREQAYLQDSAPLFLPTRWNSASSPAVRALEQRPDGLFEPFPVRLSYGETDFGLGAISSINPGTPLQNLAAFADKAHLTFGRTERAAPELSARFASLEIFELSGGEAVLAKSLPGEGAPEAGQQLWKPAEFLLQVTAAGVVGEPVLLHGSGVEAVDSFLRDAIHRASSQRMLDPGYYRVLAGP